MPPRRRTSSLIRKPRVAGLTPAASGAGGTSGAAAPSSAAPRDPVVDRHDAAVPAEPATTEPESVEAAQAVADDPTGDAPAAELPSGAEPSDEEPSDAAGGPDPDTAENAADETRHLARVAVLSRAEAEPVPVSGWRRRMAATRARPVRALAVALAVFVVLAAVFGVADHLARNTTAARNTALVDLGTTTDVGNQLNSALETIYSYDFTQLDVNERQAREVITPAFADKFGQLFAQVRQLAPQQQAVVSATVTSAAVQSIEGNRAVLVAFLDQQATRANAGAEPQQVNAAGRLTVTGEFVDGKWKIAEVVNR